MHLGEAPGMTGGEEGGGVEGGGGEVSSSSQAKQFSHKDLQKM